MSDTSSRISIKIHPLEGDDADLSVTSFLNSVEALKKAAGSFNSKNLKIVDLTKNSPVTVTMEDDGVGLTLLWDGLQDFMNEKIIPEHWKREAIDTVVELLAPIGKTVSRFLLTGPQEKQLKLDLPYKTDFQKQIGDDYSSYGTVDGMLEIVNIHGRKNTLTLYPTIGKNKITCDFAEKRLEEIRDLIGTYVEIAGMMKYRWRSKFPTHVNVDKITSLAENDLPKFSDLYGMAPNATKGEAPEDFITRTRREWE